ITTEIDDMNPEILPHVEKRLFALGALDVVREPVFMKKGRVGTRLSVLCEERARDEIASCILRETSSFGVRVESVERIKLRRTSQIVETPFGPVAVKVGYWGERAIKVAPEFEDCARLADETGVALQRVFEAARQAAGYLVEDES
ncbi:MAG: nickel insertion protein, partial [Bradymonadaceae bacterium]